MQESIKIITEINNCCGAVGQGGKISAVCFRLKLAVQYYSNLSDMYEDSWHYKLCLDPKIEISGCQMH